MEWFAIQGHYWKEVSIEQLVAEDIAIKKPGFRHFYALNITLNYKLIPTLPSWSMDRWSLSGGVKHSQCNSKYRR
jgi:hypothetical protein